MKSQAKLARFSQKLIVISVIGAFAPVAALAADDIAEFTRPDGSVSVGVTTASGGTADRAAFGQYNGLRDNDNNLLFNLNLVKRNDATGTWTTAYGYNLGLDNREAGIAYQEQGNFRVSFDYSELTRHELRTVNTGMIGAGTETPTIVRLATRGSGDDLDLQTERQAYTLGVDKWINPNLQLELSFKNETKEGSRLFGRGYQCASYVCVAAAANPVGTVLLLTPEPINSTTRQIDAKVNWSGKGFVVTGGYYGSFYDNSNGNISPVVPNTLSNFTTNSLSPWATTGTLAAAAVGGTSLQNVMQSPLALAPDNEAHQFYVQGNYAFSKTTKLNFKYAYTHATQTDSFAGAGLTGAPVGRNDLGGKIDTTLAQVGLTSRPMPNLTLLANLRYEDRDDKTPSALYNIERTATWVNSKTGNRKFGAKVEAAYQLPENYKLVVGADYLSIKREITKDADVAGIGALRAETEETTYRGELRKSMSETLNASLGFSTARRSGSDWYSLCASAQCIASGVGYGTLTSASAIVNASLATGANNYTTIFPYMLKDRDRDTWKLAADWNPLENVSVQLSVSDSQDDYTTKTNKGMDNTGANHASLDVTWAVNDKLRVTGFYSESNQSSRIAQGNLGYDTNIDNDTVNYGLNLVGTPIANWEFGGGLNFTDDVTNYKNALGQGWQGTATNAAWATTNTNQNLAIALGGLPDVKYRSTVLHLYGKYALTKASDVRVDLVSNRVTFNEWTWGSNGVPYVFSDNTTVGMKDSQNITFIGAAYTYKFH